MFQMIAVRLFEGKIFIKTIRLKLKREENMNYRHVLEIDELLTKKF